MEKPHFLGKRGLYGGFVCVILLRIAFELAFHFLTRRGLEVLRVIHRFSVFSDGSELDRSQTGGPASRKAGKAQQLSPCWDASVPPAQQPGDLQGWREVALLQPEEQKSFESKGHAASGEPRSSRPAAPAHGALSVPSY